MVVMHLDKVVPSRVHGAARRARGKGLGSQQIVLGGGVEGLEVVQLLVVRQWLRRWQGRGVLTGGGGSTLQASKLLGQLVYPNGLLKVRVPRHVRVIVAGIGVGQVAGVVTHLAALDLRATCTTSSVVDELHLVGIPLQTAAEHYVDIVRARRQVDVRGRELFGGALIQVGFLRTGSVIALETLGRIAGGCVRGVGIIVIRIRILTLLEVVLVLKLQGVRGLKGIVLRVVQDITGRGIALGEILMDVLAGDLQILVQVAVALYVVVVVAAAVVVRLAGILVEHHRGGGLLLELAVIAAGAALAAATSLAASPLPGRRRRGAGTLIIDGGATRDLPAGLHLRFRFGHLPGIQLVLLAVPLTTHSTHSSLHLRGRPAIGQEAPADWRWRTSVLRQLGAAQGAL